MIAFSSTSSCTVTSQSQYLSPSSGGPRPRPICWLLRIWNHPPFFFSFCSLPPFLKVCNLIFALLSSVICTLCLLLQPASSCAPFGFQPSQSCVTPCDVTSDHVPTCNFSTQLFLSYPYLLFLRRFPFRADYCRNCYWPHKNCLSASARTSRRLNTTCVISLSFSFPTYLTSASLYCSVAVLLSTFR